MIEEQAKSPSETSATTAKTTATTRRPRTVATKSTGGTPALSPERQDAFQAARRVWPD
jgi:hypothetical protein